MKKIFFTLLTCGFLYNAANAQYCGAPGGPGPASGPGVCDTIALSKPGFSPTTDSLAPMVNGQASTTVIYFQNYDSVPLIGRMNSLKIDSITNLPPGTCWSMGSANNTFGNKQNGCIRISGTPNGPIGVYKINVYASINAGFKVNLERDAGLKYFIRLMNDGDAVRTLDTSQNSSFMPYYPLSVNEVEGAAISSLNVYPNPMNNRAEVKFNSARNTTMTERITNIIGGEISKVTREIRTGANTFSLDRNHLPAGVYFYSLSEGNNIVTKRLIVTD